MKRYIIILLPALLLLVHACAPVEEPKPSLGETPESVTFTMEPSADNPNIITFRNSTEGTFNALWDLGNNEKAYGNVVTGKYPLKGEYVVSMMATARAGQVVTEQTIVIEETNYAMLNDPVLNMLTGGIDDLDGKTWVIDQEMIGHMGVGPTSTKWPDWWQAGPGDKAGTGLYTDEYTFNLNGLAFTQTTSGTVFINGAHADAFPGAVPAPGGDLMADYTAPDGLNFSVSENADGNPVVNITDPGWIGFYTGVGSYEILELSEDEMFIRFGDSKNDLVWYHRLIRKGYERPVEEKPIDVRDIMDDFEGNGNVTWKTGEILDFSERYDNPAPLGINTSAKVAKYERGAGEAHMWSNVQIDFDYKFDLTERNVFKLQIYMPSYNDYETESAPDWWPVYRKLTPQVALKLQDSESAEPWVSQAERIAVIAEENMDRWVEVTFDFSDVTDRQDFDRIVLQIGGEGHYIPGIFFVDNFKLMP